MRRIVVLAWILAAAPLALTGCHVDPTYGGHQVSCTSDADCQQQLGAGYACQPAGYCAKTATSDGGVADGGVGDGGVGDGGTGDGGVGDGGTPGPVVTITQPAGGSYVGNAVEIHSQVTGGTGTPTVTCAAGSGSAVAATDQGGDFVCTVNIHTLAEGAGVDLKVTATDTDNRSASDTVHVFHDSLPPTVSITQPTEASGFYVPQPGDLQVAATATDATLADLALTYVGPAGNTHAIKDCSASSTQVTCTGQISLPLGTAPGPYTLQATATDAAGHKKRAILGFQIDGKPPTVAISSHPAMPVRRDQDAPFVVDATDGETAVGQVSFTVVGGGPGGADLSIPGQATGSTGSTTFTVTGRGGSATPVLDATTKTYPIQVTATDVWGNSASVQGSLKITRLAWRAPLVSSGAGGGAALSPAVGPKGTVYVALRSSGGPNAIFALDGTSGTAVQVATTASGVIAGPMVATDAGGVVHLYLLEERSTSPGVFDVESIQPKKGTADWVYPGAGLGGRSALGLPTLAGTAGTLYVPARIPGVGGLTNDRMCVDAVDMASGNRSNAGCIAASWSRARMATLTRTGGDLIVAESPYGDAVVVEDAGGTWTNLTSGTVPGQSVGGPTATLDRFYLVSSPTSGTNPGQGLGFPWNTDLSTPAPAWKATLVGPSTGILEHAGALAGGLQGHVWFGSAKDPTVFQTVALPVNGTVSSVSLGTAGRSYALVDTGTSQGAYVAALGPVPGSPILWRFPDDPAKVHLASPATGTTAVLGPNGFLYVPDSTGTVTALITDDARAPAGWTNTRGDPGRTATVNGP